MDSALRRLKSVARSLHGDVAQSEHTVRRTAIGIFRENVKRHPESWNVWDSLGEGLAGAGQKEEAVRMYEKALAMAPEAQKVRIRGILDGLRKPG